MRAVMLSVPESLLEDRRRAGIDRWDEVWEGVLHMVPPPSGNHQRLNARLLLVFAPLAEARGLVPHVGAGVFRSGDDYRVPDQCYAEPAQVTDRGVDGGPPLVVELLSPGDETYDKLVWYAAAGVEEVLVVDPKTRQAEVFARQGSVMAPRPSLVLETVGFELGVVPGPRLRITWAGGGAEA
ncbi:MAG: Uma2 family endonuclease [Acidimicrobiia bacterium]